MLAHRRRHCRCRSSAWTATLRAPPFSASGLPGTPATAGSASSRRAPRRSIPCFLHQVVGFSLQKIRHHLVFRNLELPPAATLTRWAGRPSRPLSRWPATRVTAARLCSRPGPQRRRRSPIGALVVRLNVVLRPSPPPCHDRVTGTAAPRARLNHSRTRRRTPVFLFLLLLLEAYLSSAPSSCRSCPARATQFAMMRFSSALVLPAPGPYRPASAHAPAGPRHPPSRSHPADTRPHPDASRHRRSVPEPFGCPPAVVPDPATSANMSPHSLVVVGCWTRHARRR